MAGRSADLALSAAAELTLLIKRAANARLLAFVIVSGFATTLGACSKCDIPTPWEHGSAGSIPAACHDSPKPE